MPDNRRLLDIWIVETNTAYRGVPFETVANWLQQGRLLGEDRVRPAGTQDWFRVEKVRALAPYLPKSQPQLVEDKAEALEPVEAELSWRHLGDEDEDDPDMIPLIDIALVLLIFFMMTAAVQSGMFSAIDVPGATHMVESIREGTYFVAVDKDDKEAIRYGLGKDDKELEASGTEIAPVLARLRKELERSPPGEIRISLRADQRLPVDVVKNVTLELQGLEVQINADRARTNQERIKFHIAGEVKAPTQ
jgi:biopolymer transport protein ExbD